MSWDFFYNFHNFVHQQKHLASKNQLFGSCETFQNPIQKKDKNQPSLEIMSFQR